MIYVHLSLKTCRHQPIYESVNGKNEFAGNHDDEHSSHTPEHVDCNP